MNESARREAVIAQERVDTRVRRRARNEHESLVGRGRIDADAPQGVQVRLDGMARRPLGQPIEVREARRQSHSLRGRSRVTAKRGRRRWASVAPRGCSVRWIRRS